MKITLYQAEFVDVDMLDWDLDLEYEVLEESSVGIFLVCLKHGHRRLNTLSEVEIPELLWYAVR